MELPIVFNNRYQLNSNLGEGGLAEVYKAQDLALGRTVAVKLLREQYTHDPTFLVRFHREAQSAASLNSGSIVSVYDFGQDHNRPYIVMEYVSGQDLRTILDKGLLTIAQIVDYSLQISNAVGLAHRRGIVHGDLKPSNIMISPENRAKVTDFGLARALGESAMDDGELVWGTPAYFAPEQASGDRVVHATDVYAIGIMMYEMLAGTVPFVSDDDQEVARKQLCEHPASLSVHTHRTPEALAEIVAKSLAKDPNQRYLNGDELGQALSVFKLTLSQATSTNFSQRSGQRDSTQGQLEPTMDWLALLLALIAVLAVLGLVPLWGQIFRAYLLAAGS